MHSALFLKLHHLHLQPNYFKKWILNIYIKLLQI